MLRRGQATVRPADLRARRGEESQRLLAERIGCSEALVNHAESGRRNLSLESIIRFAEVLGCKPADIADIHVSPEDAAAIAEAVA